jgi:zinc transport system ATP-binding protein
MAKDGSKNKQVLIDIENAGVFRAGRWLIRDVSLAVHSGEIVTLIGPNGSGKTTTAKVGIGLMHSDEGRVTRTPDLTIGYVPQRLAVDWTLPLSVRRLMTLAGSHDDGAIAEALEAVGISHLADARVQDLSGGEFQRALLARAIIGKPDLLVLDEPVQGVDFSGALSLYGLVKKIREETGCGVLLISHDLHFVMAETDTVVCLNVHVCCTGTPERVAASPEYVQMFGPRAVETLAVYRHNHDHTHLLDGRVRHADGTITDDCQPDDGHHHDHEHGAGASGKKEAPHHAR